MTEKSALPAAVERIPKVKKILRSCLLISAIFSFILIGVLCAYSNFLNPVHEYLASQNRSTRPLVLLWTPYFSQSGKWLSSPSALNCPVSDCVITDDRNLLPTSSAIIFHWRNTDLNDLPKSRTSSQRWVLFNMEAPPHTPSGVLRGLTWKINWTATYRKDSEIHTYYGWISRRKIPVQVSAPPADRKLVCWLVSNCNTPSRREKFVEKLKVFIPVDVYGKCGNRECIAKTHLECYKNLSRSYKFYLSFENSICKDYVTEKLFNALSTDMVPVVMGGADYREILPPNSYIDALRFDGPRQLADYLRELDNNEEKYLSFHAWKKHYEVVDGEYRWACDLCRKLHIQDTSIHTSLEHWWYDEAKCVSKEH